MIDEKFVYLSVLIIFIADFAYTFDTIKGKIKPNRITWFLWALAPMIAFASQLQKQVGMESLLTFMAGFGPLMVFLASFVNKKSVWKISKFDIGCGTLSVVVLILWVLTNNPIIALLLSILAGGLAAIPTIIKSYFAPETETQKYTF